MENMTIAELIKVLQSVEDKSADIFFSDKGYYHDITDAKIDTLPNGMQSVILI